ncbi:MAG: hypothetical protein OXG27_08355 [Chloroflexi bacterium]|nr:hypothetical protein [Chloroflexota bacterium]
MPHSNKICSRQDQMHQAELGVLPEGVQPRPELHLDLADGAIIRLRGAFRALVDGQRRADHLVAFEPGVMVDREGRRSASSAGPRHGVRLVGARRSSRER